MSDKTHLASGPRGRAGGVPDTRRAKRTTGLKIWMGSAAIAMALAWDGPAATDTPDPSDEPDAKVSSNEWRRFASSEPPAAEFGVERVGYVISPYQDPSWKNKPGWKTESEIIMERLDDLRTSLERRLRTLANQLEHIQDTLDQLLGPDFGGPIDWEQTIRDDMASEEPQG